MRRPKLLDERTLRSPLRIFAMESRRARRIFVASSIVVILLVALVGNYVPPLGAFEKVEPIHAVKVKFVAGSALLPGPSSGPVTRRPVLVPPRHMRSETSRPVPSNRPAALEPSVVAVSEPEVEVPVETPLMAPPAPPPPPPPPVGNATVGAGVGAARGPGSGATAGSGAGSGGGKGAGAVRAPMPPAKVAVKKPPQPRQLTPEELERLRREREAAAAAAAAATGRGSHSTYRETKATPTTP